VKEAIANNQVVVLGMAQNPHVKRVRQALSKQNVTLKYLEYGSYFSLWRRRNTLKMWTGWPTFPMVFVNGIFVGGADNTEALIQSGELNALLNQVERGAA
jgi:monothiol glutaredoxin